MFAIGGDVKHLEMPLSATIGYNFLPYSRYSPYVRGGVIHHFASGDQYDSSTPGLFLAVGVDFTHFTLELATDQSKVKFDRLLCPTGGGDCTLGTTELSTYDVSRASTGASRSIADLEIPSAEGELPARVAI